MTDEQRKRHEEAKWKYQAAILAERQVNRDHIATLMATESGRWIFRHLRKICGFDKADRVMCADGSVDVVATALNSERRNIYLEIRKYALPDHLRLVEHDDDDNNNNSTEEK